LEPLEQRLLLFLPSYFTSIFASQGLGDVSTQNYVVDPNAPAGPYYGSHFRYFDGTALITSNDLDSKGFGREFGIDRGWTSDSQSDNINGTGWMMLELPHLAPHIEDDPDHTLLGVAFVSGLSSTYFGRDGSDNFSSDLWSFDKLTHDSGSDTYALLSSDGTKYTFNGFNTSSLGPGDGRLTSITDPGGNQTTINYQSGDAARVDYIARQNSSGNDAERWNFAYTTSTDYPSDSADQNLVKSVTWQSKRNGAGSYTTVRSANYSYYLSSTTDPGGSAGDLKLVTIKDASSNTIDEKYYRYYTGSFHGLKYVFEPEAFARLKANDSSWATETSDTTLKTYANDYFEYNGDKKVTTHIVHRADVPAGDQGTFTYSYSTSSFGISIGNWKYKTVETHDDDSTSNDPITTHYANYAGEDLLVEKKVWNPTLNSGSGDWQYFRTFTQYNSAGQPIWQATPGAVLSPSGSDTYDAHADLLHLQNGNNFEYLSDDAGLINVLDNYRSNSTVSSWNPRRRPVSAARSRIQLWRRLALVGLELEWTSNRFKNWWKP
jgi:hypothetical protein